ncbi:hypothetical protein Y1Q_0015656 [Alligator mississippiensis]|uniref:Uncharacterized protein n=1 Tax=Alligator mississippiensis TaxID=8496 RepID=A0A151NNK9_ALLMI|nr:hypothetical protein Y1Q_0015656 [Alligator mississippiensis]
MVGEGDTNVKTPAGEAEDADPEVLVGEAEDANPQMLEEGEEDASPEMSAARKKFAQLKARNGELKALTQQDGQAAADAEESHPKWTSWKKTAAEGLGRRIQATPTVKRRGPARLNKTYPAASLRKTTVCATSLAESFFTVTT